MRKLRLQLRPALALTHGLLASGYESHMVKAREAAARENFTEAEREYEAALREVKKHPGDMRVFLAYEGLSHIAERQSHLAAAEGYLLDALAARRKSSFSPVAELPAWLDLEHFYSRLKRWVDAAAAADRLAGIWRDIGVGAEAGTAQYLSAAGLLYHSAGDYAKAEERYRAALPMLDAVMGKSAALAQVIHRLANTLAAEDKRDEAEAQFQRAMAMSEHTKWPSAARDYRDFLRRIGRDADVAAPQVIGKREPQYSEAARTRRLVGTVVLVLEIDPSGVPVNIQVLEPLGFGLDEKAIAAAGNWRFRPGAKDGKPVTVAATIEVTFRLL